MMQVAKPVSLAMMDLIRLLQSGASKSYSCCCGSDSGHETLSQILEPRVLVPTMVENPEDLNRMDCANHTGLYAKVFLASWPCFGLEL